MLLGDFHIHSTFSDGKLSIPEIVDLYGKNGFGAIAITDHLCERSRFLGKAAKALRYSLTPATFPLYMEIIKSEAERAWRLYKMVVIPGFELTKNSLSKHRSAHILGIGIDQYIDADADVTTLARRIRSQGALAIAAHPVSTRKMEAQTYQLWNMREELKNEFDAWEVASGSILFHEVMDSALPKIANSDLHVRKQFSSWKTVVHSEKTSEAILDALRRQKVSFRFFREDGEYDLSERVVPVSNAFPVGFGFAFAT